MRVGLTGGIGSGKSTVSALLAQKGAVVIDADAIAREIVEPGEPALDEVVRAFGAAVLSADGSLNRAALAAIVFADADALVTLNSITHPRIAARSSELISAAPADAVIVYDMPLLVEQGGDALLGWDVVVVVDAPDDVRLARLVQRGMDEEDARARMAAQTSREERLSAADWLIDNSGDLSALTAQVEGLWAHLTASPTGA